MENTMGEYYLMIELNKSRLQAETEFRTLFNREPDTVIRDHNYWWIGKATSIEVLALGALGELKKHQIIEERDMP